MDLLAIHYNKKRTTSGVLIDWYLLVYKYALTFWNYFLCFLTLPPFSVSVSVSLPINPAWYLFMSAYMALSAQ
jgi:hypothetical protein